MKKSLSNSILNITLQKDTESLQRVYLNSLMSLYSLRELVIYSLVNSVDSFNLEQTIKLLNEAGVESCFDSVPKVMSPNSDITQCVSSKTLLVKQVAKASKIYIPIVVANSVASIVSLTGGDEALESLEDIRYLSLIYENLFGLINESERDTLTGLFNRKTFDIKLEKMLSVQKAIKYAALENKRDSEKRESGTGEEAWLVALDIDFFKRVNDEYGHVAGDEVLLRLSQIMKECFRHTDLLFRFGGEEFIIVLEPIPYSKVWAALERFRKAVAEHQFPLVGMVTVSIGFAGIKEHDYPVTILDYADKALYFAKDHGRNCIHNYEQLLESGQLVSSSISGDIDLF